jgi:membrane protein DedA with SNARE-associated domain
MIPAIRQLISIPAGIAKMPLIPFTVFTALGAGIWTTILATAGFAISKSAGNISYLELCTKGKAAVSSNLPIIIAIALGLALAHILISKLVLGKKK